MSRPEFAAHLYPGPEGGPRVWMHHRDPVRMLETEHLEDVLPLLAEVEKATRSGLWAVGWIAYEAAPAFDPALEVHEPEPGRPLIRFGLYRDARNGLPVRSSSPHQLTEFTPSLSADAFTEKVTQVKSAIAQGETYQVNLTYPGQLSCTGDPWSWFRSLRLAQPGPYPFYLEEPDQVILSMSPELFFRKHGRQVMCRPMKGTARPGEESCLSQSPKDRAENVMIVDMIRNDLGKVADTGSVQVNQLFEVETYPSVVQMTSSIQAEGPESVVDWMRALFPCASISGAPKRQTMSWIRRLEAGPRGLYTGCIGWIAPNGDAEFNVAIRTSVLQPDSGDVRYHTGCGIVWDSEPMREYEESLLKTRVLHQQQDPFHLIETMRVEPGGSLPLLRRHLDRLLRSASVLGFEVDAADLEERIQSIAREQSPGAKLRLMLSADGQVDLAFSPLPEDNGPWRFRLDSAPTPRQHPDIRHKTTRRDVYRDARERRPDVDETLLVNERGELMEFTIGNVYLLLDGQWVTPPLECGCLPGVRRAEELHCGQVSERILTRDDLERAEEIMLINALRGRVPMEWIR